MTTWREWWCLLAPWHRTVVVKRYHGSRRTRCVRCGCEWGIHDGLRIALPWRYVADDFAALDRLSGEYRP